MKADRLILLAAVLSLSACSTESEETRRRIARQVESHRLDQVDPRREAMKPMIGFWTVDVAATMTANAGLTQEARNAIRQDLTTAPFELEITDRHYISRSWPKTIADTYNVTDVDAYGVTIALTASIGEPNDHDRAAKLRLDGDRLFINVGGRFTCVMSPVKR